MWKFPGARLALIISFLVLWQIAFAQRPEMFHHSYNFFFIENNGQLEDQNGKPNHLVRYILPLRNGMNIQLLKNGFSYDTYTRDTVGPGDRQKAVELHFHRVDIEFLGANSNPQIRAEDQLPQRCNYTKGTPGGPQTIEAREYKRVIYRDLYPAIDLVFETGVVDSGGMRPEYYFIVHPGGNPAAIRWKYHGALRTSLSNGAIHLAISHGRINEHIPACYQDKAVRCGYKTLNRDIYAFAVAHYDPSRDLTIDPTPDLLWGTYHGGGATDWGYCTALCPDGGVVFGGMGSSPSGIATSGAYQVTLKGYTDGMVGKFTADGKLLWSTYYGGSQSENIFGVVVDKNNNVYALGQSFSNDGIATPGAFKTTRTAYNGCTNGFLVKFTPGGHLVWGTYYGGEFEDQPYAIAIDRNDDIVFCGGTCSMTGIATPGAWQGTYADGLAGQQVGAEDVFLAKFTTDGARVWSTYYGGMGFDRGYGVAIDPDNNILLTGNTYSTGMSTSGTFQPQIDVPGTESAFLSKFSAGGSLIWGTYFGKGGYPRAGGLGLGVASDKNGNAYVVGSTCNVSNIATPGALQENIGAANNYGDGFLVKFDKNGARQWGTYLGGSSTDYIYGVTTDGDNSIWVTGFLGNPAPANVVTSGSYQPTTNAAATAYVAMFDGSGNRIWGTYYGTTNPGYYAGEGRAIVTDGLGNVFVVGETGTATNNIATCGADQLTPGGGMNAFIAKFGKAATPSVLITADHQGTLCPGTPVLLTAQTQNGGTSPSFKWLVNGQPVTGNTSSISLNKLTSGDVVQCLLILDPACATGSYPSNSLTFQVDPGQPPSVTISTAAGTICPGTSTSFDAVAMNGGDRPLYQWTIDGVPAGSNSSHFSSPSLNNGDIVRCTLTHQGSCIPDSVADSNPITVSVYPVPSSGIAISADKPEACSGTSIAFTANAYGGASRSYQWEVNGSAVGTNSPAFSSTNLKDGDQVVCQLSVTDGNCTYPSSSSNAIPVIIDPVPVITITGDSIISRGKNTQLNVQVSGNPMTYSWTPDSAMNDPSISDPTVSPSITTTYTVQVTSDKGCSATGSFTVKVITRITVPNAFSPNADGRNDVFRASYGFDISDVRFSVFNRWGESVFIDKGTHKGWDGTVGGKQQPPGTYVWIFAYKDSSGRSRVLQGTVELIR